MGNLAHDFRLAIRSAGRNPLHSTTVILTLALALGANTAIFSLINGVLLSPLPYPEPDRLTMVWLDNRIQGWHEDITSYPNYVDWRDRNSVYAHMSGFRARSASWTGDGPPERIQGVEVMASFFDVMGVYPDIGRVFTESEEWPDANRSVILSHGLWVERFGGEAGAVGRTMELNGVPHEIVGVMPAGFEFPDDTRLWTPMAIGENTRQSRGALWLPVIGRLKPGVSYEAASTEMDRIGLQLEEAYPRTNENFGINVVPLLEQTVGGVRTALLSLMAAVGFVLLIACANIANLTLLRAGGRAREMALRSALGAGRWPLIRQLLVDGLVLGAVGGLAGLLVAAGLLTVFGALGPELPRIQDVGIDGAVGLFATALSLATVLLFGLLPALRASRVDAATILNSGSTRATAAGGRRLRQGMVVVELALSLVLLIGAGLMIRSLSALASVDPGFRTGDLVTFDLSLPGSRYDSPAQVRNFFTQLRERLEATPGVAAAGAGSNLFIPQLTNSTTFTIEGRPPVPRSERVEVPYDAVTPRFFETAGVPLLQGRMFDSRDTPDSPNVVIINQTMARRFWPDEDPVGKRFKYGGEDSDSPWMEIVGVVADMRRSGLDREVRPSTFIPHTKFSPRFMTLVVRAERDPLALAESMRQAVWALDPQLPVFNVQTVDQQLADRMAQRRFNMLLLGGFAAVALLLATLGIYGVISSGVSSATREIGIRMALGADRKTVLKSVLRESALLSAVGIALGLVAAVGVSGLIRSLLFGVEATDPVTYAALAAGLAAVALLAGYIPARRAARVDPAVSLRRE